VRRLLGYLALALVSGAVLFHLLSSQQGFVLVSVGRYVVEVSLWTAVALLFLLYFAIVLLRRVYGLLFLPGKWWHWRRGKKAIRFRDRTDQGLLDFFEGNWAGALVNLRGAAPRAHNPVLNYLGATVASLNAGENGEAQLMLYNLKKTGKYGEYAAALAHGRLLLAEGRHAEALLLGKHLLERDPGHPGAQRFLVECHRMQGNWPDLEKLLPALKKGNAYTEVEMAALEKAVYSALLESLDLGHADESAAGRHAALDRLWSQVPKRLQDDESLVAALVIKLRHIGRHDLAEAKLRRQINRRWSEKLVSIYGTLVADATTQLTVAEAWLVDHPDTPELLTALGRICAGNQLWGKARTYFEKSLALQQQPDCLYQLGLVHRQLGETGKSAECFERGLKLVV